MVVLNINMTKVIV